MIKKINFKNVDVTISVILILISAFSIIFRITNNTVFAILLLALNIYMLIKNKDNKLMLITLLMIFYFNYSFAIIKYIGEPAKLLHTLYEQLNDYEMTMHIGIISQIIFLAIINIILNINKMNIVNKINLNKLKLNKLNFNKINIIVSKLKTDIKDKKLIVRIMQVALCIILLFHLIMKIDYNTTIFEYSLFLFIIAFYFSKDNKKSIRITEGILVGFCIYSILCGERIAVLQLLIVDFVMNYMEKLKVKTIVLLICLGVIFFTIAGLYGDFLDYKMDFKELDIKYIVNTFKERRLALDTSVSAYFSGLSMIDLRHNYSGVERVTDLLIYLTKYTVLGASANYVTPDIRMLQYQVNYGGGFITSYFYFWAGWIGIIGISTYVGFLFKNIKHKYENDYLKMLSIVVVSTLPRWFLYVPTFLFRGLILFTILYLVVIAFDNRKKIIDYIIKKGKLINERRTNNNNSTNI